MRRTRILTLVMLAAGAVTFASCRATDSVAPNPSVVFVFDAPFCGTILFVHFMLDGVEFGMDTFRINVAPGPHTATRPFAATAGAHVIGARVDTSNRFAPGYVWPDKHVLLSGGQTFTDTLPFYCS